MLDLFIQGVSVQGVYVLRGICPGGKCPGGKCPEGYMSGGKCPGVHVGGGGGYVLAPSNVHVLSNGDISILQIFHLHKISSLVSLVAYFASKQLRLRYSLLIILIHFSVITLELHFRSIYTFGRTIVMMMNIALCRLNFPSYTCV